MIKKSDLLNRIKSLENQLWEIKFPPQFARGEEVIINVNNSTKGVVKEFHSVLEHGWFRRWRYCVDADKFGEVWLCETEMFKLDAISN